MGWLTLEPTGGADDDESNAEQTQKNQMFTP